MVCNNGTWLPANSSSNSSSWSNYSNSSSSWSNYSNNNSSSWSNYSNSSSSWGNYSNNSSSWSSVAKCVPAKCTELPDAPRNGMVVAPNLDHGMVGKFEVGGQITSAIIAISWC